MTPVDASVAAAWCSVTRGWTAGTVVVNVTLRPATGTNVTSSVKTGVAPFATSAGPSVRPSAGAAMIADGVATVRVALAPSPTLPAPSVQVASTVIVSGVPTTTLSRSGVRPSAVNANRNVLPARRVTEAAVHASAPCVTCARPVVMAAVSTVSPVTGTNLTSTVNTGVPPDTSSLDPSLPPSIGVAKAAGGVRVGIDGLGVPATFPALSVRP